MNYRLAKDDREGTNPPSFGGKRELCKINYGKKRAKSGERVELEEKVERA